MGFLPEHSGPNVQALREVIARRVSNGLTYMSAGSWSPGCGPAGMNLTPEERARAFLAIEWAQENGHSYLVKVPDPPIHWTFNTKTMRRGIRIHWSQIVPWIGDRFRELAFLWRVRRDRRNGRCNPYA